MKKQINEQFLKMQKLAGLITESQMKDKLRENQSDFDIVDRVISQISYITITDPESLQDEIEHSDLVDLVADEMGGDFTKARQAIEDWGMKKFGQRANKFGQKTPWNKDSF